MILETVRLQHVKVSLALHRLRDGDGPRPLLLFHGLGERTPAAVPETVAGWPGPIWGLDLTGHGDSSLSLGGGYTAEILMADADHALDHLGEVTIVGRGLGAYVALLVAGARAERVRGAVLTDGPGLAGGGPSPLSPVQVVPVPGAVGPPDPWAMAELARDVRPPDYATSYARLALQLSGLDEPLTVSAVVRPPWLEAVAAEPGVVQRPLGEALRHYAATPRSTPR
ncbi:MAG: mhpC [Acidimicrobiales bacterium]|nr:mhpC [Acidimicrobiales bacterium]